MLNDDERREIVKALSKYATKRAAGPEALDIVQARRGWISDDSLKDVADMLEMSFEELDSVATFYNLIYRKPVGRHVILLCDSISCYICGCKTVLDCLERLLGIGSGETTPDGSFTLLPTACLGACDHAPVMMIDGILHVDLTPEKVEEILKKYK